MAFDIVLINRNSKRHPCPHCGTEHVFDFDSAEKQIAEQLKEVCPKGFPEMMDAMADTEALATLIREGIHLLTRIRCAFERPC